MNEMPAVARGIDSTAAASPSGHGNCSPGEDQDLEVEMALLTISEDMGGPMEDVDLSTLSTTEKQALLAYLRKQLGLSPAGPDTQEEPRSGEVNDEECST